MYVVRDDIPIPQQTNRHGTPWADINVGQCVEVPIGKAPNKEAVTIRNSCAYLQRKHNKAYIVRLYRDEGVIRVWRTA